MLDELDPEIRAKHIPNRSVGCVISDLGVAYCGQIGPDGLLDLHPADPQAVRDCEVRVSCASDELVALASGEDGFLTAWMQGRVSIGASVRDILRLRALIGL